MYSPEVDRQIVLAARAKTKVKQRGTRGICNLSSDEILAMAFVVDVFLSDYSGPLKPGEPDTLPLQSSTELEAI